MKKILLPLFMTALFAVAVCAQDKKKEPAEAPKKECCEKEKANKKEACCAEKKDAKKEACCDKKEAEAKKTSKSAGKK
jgi:hypothetical protein